MLDAGIVDQNVDSTEFLRSLFDKVLSVSRFGEICEDELSLDLVAGNLSLDFLNFILWSKSVQDDVSTGG